MGYVSGFEYDIFLSYASVDNPRDHPWVDRFRSTLQICLDQCLGRAGTITVWYDKEKIGAGVILDRAIRHGALDRSALLVLLVSAGSLHPEGYCREEVRHFQATAKNQATGLKVDGAHGPGTFSRIVPLQLRSQPVMRDWPDWLRWNEIRVEQLYGTDGHELSPDTFLPQIRGVANQIWQILRVMSPSTVNNPTFQPTAGPTPDRTQALQFALQAAARTRAIMTSIGPKDPVTTEQAGELQMLWSHAAALMRPSEPELAMMLEWKRYSWADLSPWKPGEYHEGLANLDWLFGELTFLLFEPVVRDALHALTTAEIRHLKNLTKAGLTYKTTPMLQRELRNLRELRLIKQRDIEGATVPVANLPDWPSDWVFGKYFQLTDLGRSVVAAARTRDRRPGNGRATPE